MSRILLTAFALALTLSSCDFSARSDLKAAENALKLADEWHASQWAEREYKKAEAAFNEAVAYNRNNEINLARDRAAEAKSLAEEAAELARVRFQAMEEEKDKLGGYKP